MLIKLRIINWLILNKKQTILNTSREKNNVRMF